MKKIIMMLSVFCLSLCISVISQQKIIFEHISVIQIEDDCLYKQDCLAFAPPWSDVIGDYDLCDFTGGGGGSTFNSNMYSTIKSAFPGSNPSNQVFYYSSYNGFKSAYGKASDYVTNGEWHHIVEQQTVKNGINNAIDIYNNHNTVAIPYDLHVKISSYYSSMNPTYGMTNRVYINTLPYDQQYAKGIEILKIFSNQMGITPMWF